MTRNNYDNDDSKGTWLEYRKFVLAFCETMEERLNEVDDKIDENKTDITIIKTRIAMVAGIAGFIGSLIPIVGHILFSYLSK